MASWRRSASRASPRDRTRLQRQPQRNFEVDESTGRLLTTTEREDLTVGASIRMGEAL
jgi:hypothetical protein